MASRVISALVVAFAASSNVAAGASLRAQGFLDVNRLTKQAIDEILLSELSILGRRGELAVLEEQLRPMFAALPKNSHGKVEPAAVRYALHRFFVSSRGWFMKGLLPGSTAWNASSGQPAVVMQDRVPEYIQTVFEQRLQGEGLGLHELAAFAATLQDLVHAEAAGILRDTYEIVDVPLDAELTPDLQGLVVRRYLANYVLGSQAGRLSKHGKKWEKAMAKAYGGWQDVQLWAEDLQLTLANDARLSSNPFSIAAVGPAEVVQEIGHRFGRFQDLECRDIKETLIDMEYRGSGRVLLSDFYRHGLNTWQFSESVEYLRAIGALDESDPRRPAVVIPNYVGSSSNCLASSSFYSVCCLDECEGLIRKIEREVAAPTADPQHIAQIVAGLPSDSIDAPRNLSSTLLARLDEIAQVNGGRVPLQSRLFLQFMHHAYPRECPFPHVTGTTVHLTPDEWKVRKGRSIKASVDVMKSHASVGNTSSDEGDAVLLPWTETEELIIGMPSQEAVSLGWLRTVLLMAALGGVVVSSASRWNSLRLPTDESKLPRYSV